MGQFFLNSSAYAEWTVVDPPAVSSNWELFNPRYNWAIGQDSENQTGVLLYFLNGSWIPAPLPNVSSDWALSGVDLTSSYARWAVGQDFENRRGVLLLFTNPYLPTLPTVTTSAISDITATTATGGGNIASDGGAPVTARGICWSTSASPAVEGTCTSDGTGTGVFTSSITGLTPGTLYHVRAYATNSGGTAYGNDLTFSTTGSPVPTPTLTTTPVSNIADTTATGGGNITSDGGTSVTARGVCWSTSANPAVGGNCTTDGAGTGVFTSSITGLTSGTQYHVRAYATNLGGSAYGNDLTFSTTGSPLATLSNIHISNVAAAADSGSNLIWPCVSVTPPNVSSDWGLSAVHFSSPDQGWAVGEDFENGRGVLLHFLYGLWTSVVPPNVNESLNWGLSSVHFRWAVGQDWEYGRGVILYFSGGSWTSVNPPDVSSNWGLSAVHFLSSDEAWAVGEDFENGRGVLLHYVRDENGNVKWTSVIPPDVSSNWGLSSVDFTSPDEGWAVGEDFENKRGVLLHFLKTVGQKDGSWTSVSPPDVSEDWGDWGLSGIHLISPTGGWAVGVGQASDGSNLTGFLLRYTVPQISVSPMSINFNNVEIGAFLEKTVTVKNTGNGNLVIGTITAPPPFSISTNSCSGKSLAWSQTCKVTYRFLPVSAGTFSGNSNIPSNGSSSGFYQKTVTLTGTGKGETLNYINLLSPADRETFTACDYSNPPTFQWESGGTFTSIEVQFSSYKDFSKVPLKIKGNLNVNQLIIKPNIWKRVLLLRGDNGGRLFWRVVAKKKDKTMVQSDVFFFLVQPPNPGAPEISHTSRTTSPPPTLSWGNDCNIMFTVWFGNDPDFRKSKMNKMPIFYKIKNSDGFQETFTKELTPGQWHSIRKLGGDVTGANLYWYVESRDIIGRRVSTGVMPFVLTD